MTTPLQQAAQAMIDRWDSTDWKDTPHTAHYVDELRKALDAELAQSVEPVAWAMNCAAGLPMDIICPDEHARHEGSYTIPLYLHPPQPKATTPLVSFAWVVLDEDGIPAYCAQSRQLCNDHINEAISEYDIEEARKWVICEAYKKQGEKP